MEWNVILSNELIKLSILRISPSVLPVLCLVSCD